MKRPASCIAAAAAAAVVTAALTLTACSGSSSTSTASSSGATGAADPNAVFTFGQTAPITQLDPNTSGLLSESVYFSLLYDGLTQSGPDGSAQPDLATSWKTSADALTWTFTLRSNVHYADGRAFTATDAVQNINRVLDPKVTSQWRTNISMVSQAVATDPTTLTLTLSRPNAQLPASLIPIKMTDVPNIGDVNKKPNGTGPYMLKSFVPNQSLDLVANPQYWGGKAKLAEVKMQTYPDITAAETALRGGTLTALWNPPATAVSSLQSGARKVLKAKDPGGLDVFELDTTSAPFDNPKARQALAYATDRASMLKAAFGGNGVVNASQTPVSPLNQFADKSLPSYGFDLDKAKQLFSDAGVGSGTSLTYWTLSGAFPEMTTMGEILQQDLKKIGITLTIQSNETSTWAAKFYPDGKKWPGLIVPNELSFQPAPNSFAFQWFSASGTCECNWKGTDTYNTAVQALEAASTTQDQTTHLASIQKELNAASPITVIANSAAVSVVQPSVQGAWVDSNGVLHLEDASITG